MLDTWLVRFIIFELNAKSLKVLTRVFSLPRVRNQCLGKSFHSLMFSINHVLTNYQIFAEPEPKKRENTSFSVGRRPPLSIQAFNFVQRTQKTWRSMDDCAQAPTSFVDDPILGSWPAVPKSPKTRNCESFSFGLQWSTYGVHSYALRCNGSCSYESLAERLLPLSRSNPSNCSYQQI
jgi:hypothetical protein